MNSILSLLLFISFSLLATDSKDHQKFVRRIKKLENQTEKTILKFKEIDDKKYDELIDPISLQVEVLRAGAHDVLAETLAIHRIGNAEFKSYMESFINSNSIQWAHPKRCNIPAMANKTNLTTKQITAICNAAEFYNINVLTKKGKTIVIAGESHVREEQSELDTGIKMSDEFNFRGYELNISLNHQDQFLLDENNYTRNLQTLNRNSLIGKITTFLDDLEKRINHYSQYDSFTSVGSLTTAMTEKGYTLSSGVKNTYTGEFNENARNHFQKAESVEEFKKRVDHKDKIINFHLERDIEIMRESYADCSEEDKNSDYGSCESNNAVITYRNFIMVKGINDALDFFPEREQLFIVVGASHLAGITDRLIEEGWSAYGITRGLYHNIEEVKEIPLIYKLYFIHDERINNRENY